MAMGRRPPPFFSIAIKEGPAKYGAMDAGAAPLARRDEQAANCSSTADECPSVRASRRCWARSPVGPGAESLGKLRKAVRMASESMLGEAGSCWAGTVSSGARIG